MASFPFDPFVNGAKEAYQNLLKESQSKPTHKSNPSLDIFMSQLNSWFQTNQNLPIHMNSIQCEQPQLLNTVFRFEPDHFKVIINLFFIIYYSRKNFIFKISAILIPELPIRGLPRKLLNMGNSFLFRKKKK